MCFLQRWICPRKICVVVGKLTMLIASRNARRDKQRGAARTQLAVAPRHTTVVCTAAIGSGGRDGFPAGSFTQRTYLRGSLNHFEPFLEKFLFFDFAPGVHFRASSKHGLSVYIL